MTRLFIRFYVGVIVILVVALCIMAFAFKNRFDTDFPRIKEKALGGGVNVARQALKLAGDDPGDSVLEKLRAQFDYPVEVVAGGQVADEVREWFVDGDDVMVHVGDKLLVLTPSTSGTAALKLGPVTLPQGPVETDMIVSLGVVLLLVAIAIVLMLRPLARQLGAMERTAISFADGDLSARVDVKSADSARTLAEAFNEMAGRTEALVRTQRELLQAVSHELRTPLARVNLAIDLIRTARDERERELRLKSLDSAAEDLDELVGELLQYVRLETGLPQVAWESIELAPLVEELIEKHSHGSSEMQFQIGADLDHGDVRIVADRSGLARALGNLLANASRFGRRCVIINATATPAGVIIDVDDDGPGIPEPDRQRAFEPFVRLEDTGRGAGLGLALVKRIVANHGGTAVAVESPFGGCRIRTFWAFAATPDECT